MSFPQPRRLSIITAYTTRKDRAMTYHQVGHMPAEEYTRVEEGVNGFYDRLADQVARR
jgi:hypothetical protein